MSHFVNVLLSIVFHVTVKFIFRRSYCKFSRCSRGLTHHGLNLYSFSFAYFIKLSNKICSFVNPIFLGRFFFVIKDKNARTVSLESFVFIPFASTVLSNRSWRTRRYFTPLLFLASLSKYAKSIQEISFLNVANVFIHLNLRVARVKFV